MTKKYLNKLKPINWLINVDQTHESSIDSSPVFLDHMRLYEN